MPLQVGAEMLRQQIPVGRFRTDDFLERGKHHQPLGIQQIAESQPPYLEAKLPITVVLQHPAVVLGQQLRNGPAIVIRRQTASRHVQGRGNHNQPHRFGFQQRLEPIEIQATVRQHWQLDHPHASGLEQTQYRPVARRFNHHCRVVQAQYDDQYFQHTP
ncbi:hypothetical protein D3C81_1378850 [compost metagenome]